jgi:predicted ATPase
LGVHPDQFHLIMNFLKEQAEDKQIIMSTHSPEALNILEPDELGNIIVTKYDKKKGTTMSHLNKKQVEKAKAYMKELDLSDYWLSSDLEA